MNDELSDYIEKLREEYQDIKQVEVYANQTRIAVHKCDDASEGLGRHVTETFLEHGFVVSSTGYRQTQFKKVQVNMEFVN